MTDSPLATAHRLLTEATAALAAAAGAGASDDELLSALTLCEGVSRQLDRLTVATVSALQRRGTFVDRGYKTTTAALGDLLGWERFEARRRVTAAEQVGERVGLDGAVLPARLPGTAAVFAAGRAPTSPSLPHARRPCIRSRCTGARTHGARAWCTSRRRSTPEQNLVPNDDSLVKCA